MYGKGLFNVAAIALVGLGFLGCEAADRVVGPAEIGAPLFSSSSSGWKVVEDDESTTGGVSAVIDASGGQLALGNIILTVPAEAVEGPTTFNMKRGGGHMRVSLTATVSTTNDVGSAGFARALTLTFDYKRAEALLEDASNVAVVWIKDDGTYEPQPTTVDTVANLVHGSISHFSDYAMASN